MLLFLLGAWLGLLASFPGGALARYLEGRINHDPEFAVSIAPLRLRWNGLRSERVELKERAPGAPKTWLRLTDVRLPISLQWVRGASLGADLGSGHLRLYFTWAGDELDLEELDAKVEDFTALAGLLPLTLRGRVTGTARLRLPRDPNGLWRREVPEGLVQLRATGMEVADLKVAGASLPPVRLESVELSLRTARGALTIERLVFQGDLQGSITGSIAPNLAQPAASRMNLAVRAEFRQAWINNLGDLRAVAGGFLTGGRLEGTLEGPLTSPTFNRPGERR